MRAPFIKEKTKQEIPYQKQIIQVIISYLCFLRKQFPKGCFVTRKIGEMNIPVIQYKTDHQEAYLLYQILEFGISEALELNCLKTLEYCIHDQSTDDIIETYVFNFQHCTEMHQVSEFNLDSLLVELTKKTRLLAQTLDPFTAETYFTIRLGLCEDSRPYKSWHPPFFKCKRIEKTSKDLSKSDTITLKIGNMVLPGNECSILVKSTHDALLCSEPKAANAKVQFDPEFFKEIQQPDSPDIAKSKSDGWEVSSPIKSHAKDVYERVKTFLIESKTPIMKDVVKNLSGLSYQLVKECFLKLCEENFLTRRGRRYYFNKNEELQINKALKRAKKRETPLQSKKRRLEQGDTEKIVSSWFICETPVVSKIQLPKGSMKEENPDSERILESAVRDSQVFHRCLVSEQPILQAKKSLKFD